MRIAMLGFRTEYRARLTEFHFGNSRLPLLKSRRARARPFTLRLGATQ